MASKAPVGQEVAAEDHWQIGRRITAPRRNVFEYPSGLRLPGRGVVEPMIEMGRCDRPPTPGRIEAYGDDPSVPGGAIAPGEWHVADQLSGPSRQHRIRKPHVAAPDRRAAGRSVAQFVTDDLCHVGAVVRPDFLETDHIGIDAADRLDDRTVSQLPWSEPPPQIPRHHTQRHLTIVADRVA